MRPISHEKKNHLGKSCVTMTYLMDKLYEKLSLVMLYVKNDPSQEVQPVKKLLKKTVLKSPMQLIIYLQRFNFNYEKNEFCKIYNQNSPSRSIFRVISR